MECLGNRLSNIAVRNTTTYIQRRTYNDIMQDCQFSAWKSPGPVYYVHPEMTRQGKDGTPVYSMLGRQRDMSTFKTPGPGTYNTELVHPQGERHAPAYTMSARTPIRRCDSNPAPNRYGLPPLLGSNQINKKSAPSYSMTNRNYVGSYCEDLAKTPGPGHYTAMDPNIIYNRQPVYSLQSRNPMPQDKTRKPGPGQHYPEHVYINKHSAPNYSMGIRHSQYITPLIVDC